MQPTPSVPQCLLRRLATVARDPSHVRTLGLEERRVLAGAAAKVAATQPEAAETALAALADESAASLRAELREGLRCLLRTLPAFDRVGLVARWATSPSRARREMLGEALADGHLTPVVGIPAARELLAAETAVPAAVSTPFETARMWRLPAEPGPRVGGTAGGAR